METAKKKAATYKLANYHHVGTWNQHCHNVQFFKRWQNSRYFVWNERIFKCWQTIQNLKKYYKPNKT